ncbi:MAG: MBL fold metallo-hydrolase, partial [Clostridia bacterium]|nr:MBL fold metallo-hydrolase [Clostridia bacterium]
MKLIFCGAAKCVTGSCHLLDTAAGKILVDCGMRQGEDAKGEFGEGTFPFDPADIRLVLATHAHIDHIGLIPLLVKRGFAGEVLSTDATAQLATIMLPDSAHIQEQDAEYQNRKNQRAGRPLVEPLYTGEDAQEALKRFHSVPYGKLVEVLPGVTCR